ncbi:MAG: GNAT family N-acetyltransferase [Acidobacteriia bacterium]|nr:GNAT family N-acetyltransferase [Terriglobia bacterium]
MNSGRAFREDLPPRGGVHIVIAGEDAVPWRDFVSRFPDAEIGHRWEYLDLLGDVFGHGPLRLVAKRGERWVGILPLVVQKSFLGRFVTSVPYLNYAGVLASDPEARAGLAEEAMEQARRLGADRLELRGREGGDLPIDAWRGKCSYALALDGGTEVLQRGLGAKLRAQIKRPLKEGYAARVDGPGGYGLFYPLLVRKWHELGSPVLPRAFFERLGAVFGDDVSYSIVEKNGQPVAAGALLRSGERVEIPWAASLREHDRFGVNMLVYWTALEFAVARGARVFDFGRSTPGTGNARFKLQWGASESALVWNVFARGRSGRSVEKGDERRSVAAAVWRRLPRSLTSRLGPFLAARIPY